MTAFGGAHPLDVDLADLVDGLLDPARATDLEDHLAGCLLCRIKRRRLQSAPPAALDADLRLPPVSFPLRGGAGAASGDAGARDAGGEPEPHDLWLIGEESGGGADLRMLVVVLRREGDRVLVAPVTFDTGAADDETVLVDDSAVYPSLAGEVPRSVLARRIGTCDLSAATTGPPITDGSDPRLEVRQHLADQLWSLEERLPDPAAAADAPPRGLAQVRSALIADLRAMRGAPCAVRAMDGWDDVVAADRAGWAPIAVVDEVGVVLVVLDTPHGLGDDGDFNVARAVLTRFNGTALVVLASVLGDLVDVYDAPSLNYGIEAPSGRQAPPRPLISGLSPFDAIAKFLDQTTGARAVAAPFRGSAGRVDVGAVLRGAAAAALSDAVRQSSRFKIAPKRRGYESVETTKERFQAAMVHAFDGDAAELAQRLIELAAEREP